MAGRRIECARGKVVGGSSSINAMAYVRGNRADYDRWAASGLPGWSYADVLPYFRRQESWEGGANAYRGGDGPLATRRSRYEDPLVTPISRQRAAAGHPLQRGLQRRTTGRLRPHADDDPQRTARRAPPAPICVRCMARENLEVIVNAHATRIVLEGVRAVGVEYLVDEHAA